MDTRRWSEEKASETLLGGLGTLSGRSMGNLGCEKLFEVDNGLWKSTLFIEVCLDDDVVRDSFRSKVLSSWLRRSGTEGKALSSDSASSLSR